MAQDRHMHGIAWHKRECMVKTVTLGQVAFQLCRVQYGLGYSKKEFRNKHRCALSQKAAALNQPQCSNTKPPSNLQSPSTSPTQPLKCSCSKLLQEATASWLQVQRTSYQPRNAHNYTDTHPPIGPEASPLLHSRSWPWPVVRNGSIPLLTSILAAFMLDILHRSEVKGQVAGQVASPVIGGGFLSTSCDFNFPRTQLCLCR